MKKDLVFEHKLVKGDLIEVYAKRVVNLGLANYIFEKIFRYDSKNSQGYSGFMNCMYSSPLVGYISRQLMDANDPVRECEMTREFLFTGARKSRILLKSTDQDTTEVELEGSTRWIKRTEKLLNEMFTISEEDTAMSRVVSDFILKHEEPRSDWN